MESRFSRQTKFVNLIAPQRFRCTAVFALSRKNGPFRNHWDNRIHLYPSNHRRTYYTEKKSIKYRTHAIIARSGFETALDYKPRILGLKIAKFAFLAHKLSVILTALQLKL